MRIIALKGKGACGKTSTLNLVYDDLFKTASISTPKKSLGGNDFECTMTLNNGKVVAFYTMGDYSHKTLDAIDRYNQLGVDILILATNNRFIKPTRKIMQFPHSRIINKSIAMPKTKTNIQTENQRDCTIIISLI